jgi:hypothetical protein
MWQFFAVLRAVSQLCLPRNGPSGRRIVSVRGDSPFAAKLPQFCPVFTKGYESLGASVLNLSWILDNHTKQPVVVSKSCVLSAAKTTISGHIPHAKVEMGIFSANFSFETS